MGPTGFDSVQSIPVSMQRHVCYSL